MKRVCVYCGSSAGLSPAYADAARGLGELLAARGLGLVYGGGRVGLMGVVADAALAGGGEVVGVIPGFLKEREVDHRGLTELFVVDTMHTRKAKMAELADAFVALPGGIGTMEELFEVWTWTQLGGQDKPVGLLDVDGFYGPLVAFLDHLVETGFVRPEHRAILQVATRPDELLAKLAAWRPLPVAKWMTPSQT
jgi:uncharacterized protein (TIGR00730 family)